MPASANPVVLITGASTGFGREIARLLAQNGYTVFGTTRNPNPTDGENYRMLTLDVQSDQSVKNGLASVLAAAGRIDVLINNAGQVLNGPAEETSLDQAKNLFETNFFGLVRTTLAVLPIFRSQHKGRIINFASLAGRVGVPGHSFYSATKYAVEGYTEALAAEVRQFGIRVSLIEPGFFKTNLAAHAPQASNPIPDYDAVRDHLSEHFKKGVETGGNPEKAARLVLHILRSRHPKLHYPVGRGSTIVPIIKTLLPQRIFARGLRLFFRLP
jgi:NAD(P)-dependent dehydrogenase (short-subunit alcohol dehydrogenase family)